MNNLKPINELTPSEINREIAERTGQPWHEIVHKDEYAKVCSCGEDFNLFDYEHTNPDYYHDPVATLKVMQARKDYLEFVDDISTRYYNTHAADMVEAFDFITERLLAKASLEWMRNHEKQDKEKI